MKIVHSFLAGAVILAAISAAAFLIVGPSKVWGLFGPADLGPIAFETLERRTSPNDSLACPAGLCKARSDVVPPVLATNARALQAAMAVVIASERDVTKVDADAPVRTERYVQRSALMKFPDTIVVRYVELSGTTSTVAIYSRSQLGHSDLGANKARIERWLAKLQRSVPVAQ